MEPIKLVTVDVTCMNLGTTCGNKKSFKIKVQQGTKRIPPKLCVYCHHKDDGVPVGTYPSHWNAT